MSSVGPEDDGVAAAREVFGDRLALAEVYADLLSTAGVERGLIGPRETGRLWSRHLLNSAALAPLLPDRATVVDVGSGAGLPGIPLALARPDLGVTLLEPLLRRVTFLGEVVDRLDLGEQLRVVRARAEDHTDTYDVVVSRALAPLPRLLGWCLPLVRSGGTVLALKGRSAVTEVAEADRELRRRGLTAEILEAHVAGMAESTTVVRVTHR